MTNAISPSRRSAVVGTLTTFQNLAQGGNSLQQRIALIAHGNTATSFSLTKLQIFSAAQAGEVYGLGSQIHIMATQLFPTSGDGVGDIPVVVFPLADGTTQADGLITPTGTPSADGTYTVTIGNVESIAFVIPASAAVAAQTPLIEAAINATPEMPVVAVSTATTVEIDMKWKGTTGNGVLTSVGGPSLGITFGITDLASGAGDAEIDATLLAQFGEVFYTMILQGLGGTTAALDALSAFGEGLWLPESARPLAGAFYASTEATLATAITVPDARGTDRVNVQLSAPGSPDLPWKVAARQVARIAKVANSSSPATDYIGQIVDGIDLGSDEAQWTSAQRQTSILAGTCNIVARDGQMQLNDTITMFHPSGDPTPAYRYVNDIVRLQQLLNDMDIIFNTPKWQAPPLIPDDQATTDATAKKPAMAKAEVVKLIQGWALKAIIADPAFAIASIVVAIDGANARRLNITLTVKLSGNAGIISMDLNFGFSFGGAVAA